MKKRIAFNALGDNAKWTGGLYYIKNMAFGLTQNENIMKKYDIYIFTLSQNVHIFLDVKNVKIVELRSGKKWSVLLESIKKHIDVIFPLGHNIPFIPTKTISWIPDFQHNILPEFFSEEECLLRSKTFEKYILNNNLILSSEDSKNSANKFYGGNGKNIEVVHFVSYIEPNIRRIKNDEVLKKYDLKVNQYSCIMNQFWQHKNHIVVFEAIKKYFEKNPNSNFKFVFSGKLEDYRSPDYIDKLKKYMNEETVREHIVLLGFVERDVQLSIMKNAAYIIQPSLFEGWGTVVEDAKVLDKTILLSDIPVHREQMSEKSILFDPNNSVELAKLIEKENCKEHYDNVEEGIKDMYIRAFEYSKNFERLLERI